MCQIKNLDLIKASPFAIIPIKILTVHSGLFASMVQYFITESIDTSKFPNELKKGEIVSLFKNSDAFAKKNYNPMTVLPVLSKSTKEHIQMKLFIKWKMSYLPIFVRIFKAIAPNI